MKWRGEGDEECGDEDPLFCVTRSVRLVDTNNCFGRDGEEGREDDEEWMEMNERGGGKKKKWVQEGFPFEPGSIEERDQGSLPTDRQKGRWQLSRWWWEDGLKLSGAVCPSVCAWNYYFFFFPIGLFILLFFFTLNEGGWWITGSFIRSPFLSSPPQYIKWKP